MKHPKYRVRYVDPDYPASPVMTSSYWHTQRDAKAYAHKHLRNALTIEIVVPFEVVERLR